MKYTQAVISGKMDRHVLVEKALSKFILDKPSFAYFDDRQDNIEEVKQHYPTACYFHVKNPLELCNIIKEEPFC